MKKKMILFVITGIMTMAMALTVFAANWEKNVFGWWYRDGGSYLHDGWAWIDDDNDGISECYYFGDDGYLLTDTVTPDGYTVNEDGAWVIDGEIQTSICYDEKTAEALAFEYYNTNHPANNGNYIIFYDETTRIGDEYYFIVRWQMSEEEAERRLKEGRDVAANIYENTLIFNRLTGEIREDWGAYLLNR
ncbi:MAG: hypothetical protein LUE65_01965 [Clostridiales bacterium]|nr:hypothetical protein [Clostridiales bacterium]